MGPVFYTSPWVPAEWIRAHGLEPRGIWFAEDFDWEPPPLAAGSCGFAQAVVRLAQKRPEAVFIFTTHCDQLRRGFDGAAALAPERVFLFNLPATWQTPTAERLFAAELERLGRFLVRHGGQTPSGEALRKIRNQYELARRQLIDAAAHLRARPYAEAVARFHWDGSLEGLSHLPSDASRASHPDGVPLALVGGPLPRSRWRVLDALERAGGRVVLNATEAGERSLWTTTEAPVAARERLGDHPGSAAAEAQALARACLASCADVFQRPNTRLYQWLQERLTARQVHGLVLWHYVGCDLWRAEAQSLREALGLPLLLLDASEAASDAARQSGRIEAFLESLQ